MKTLLAVFSAVMALASPLTILAQPATNTVLYTTGFELTEGYVSGYTVAGQNGWLADVDGGNGLITGVFDGLGQQAFVGYGSIPNDQLNLWHPLQVVPTTNLYPYLRFSVVMAIFDSTKPQRDDFRWSVYNMSNERLFSLDFDGENQAISYLLQGATNFVSTGTSYTKGVEYELVIEMDFKKNLWSAIFNQDTIVSRQPISPAGRNLNFSDMDAVWMIRNPGTPGDNYLVFDNFQILALSRSPASIVIEPRLQVLSGIAQGQFSMRVIGETNQTYMVESSSDLVHWAPVKTAATGVDGTLDVVDPAAQNQDHLFYRAKSVSP